jgi:hypothetical protein
LQLPYRGRSTPEGQRSRIFRRDAVKRILVDSLPYTSLMNQVALYAFVIMPNHVHDNPVQPHWDLDVPEAYGWSSARFCLFGEPALIRLRDAGKLLA